MRLLSLGTDYGVLHVSVHVVVRPTTWDDRPRHHLPRGYLATIPYSRVADVIRRVRFVSRAAGLHLIRPCCPHLANTIQELGVGHCRPHGQWFGTVAGCPCRLQHSMCSTSRVWCAFRRCCPRPCVVVVSSLRLCWGVGSDRAVPLVA